MVDLASPPYLLRFSEGTELVDGCAPAFKKSHLFVRLHGGWRWVHRLDFISATAVLSRHRQIDGEVKIARRVMWWIRREAWSKCRGPDQTRVFVGDKNAARGATIGSCPGICMTTLNTPPGFGSTSQVVI
jgi:hypothetical protein